MQCTGAWSATQVDYEGWCASCKEDKPEAANRNDTATSRHIGLLVTSALSEELNLRAGWGCQGNCQDGPIASDLDIQHDRRPREETYIGWK